MDKETVLAFIGGALFGAVCAAVYTGKRYKRELDSFCDEYDAYLDELQEKWDKHCEDCQQNHDIVDDDDIDENEAQALVEQLNMMASLDNDEETDNDEDEEDEETDIYPDFEHDTYSETVQKMKDENGIVDYTSFSQKKNKTEDEADAEDDNKKETDRVQDEYLEEGEDDGLVIRFIDDSEYGDQDDYDQVELTYLEGSDIFLTEDDIKYDAYSQIGGKKNFKEGMEESVTGSVYIRNTALEIDFHIVSDIHDFDTYIEETSSN